MHDLEGLALVRSHLFELVSSASPRSAGSRCPHSTSRRTARRQRAELGRRAPRPRGEGLTKPTIAARSSEIASRTRCSSAGRSCGLGADRGEPLGDVLVAGRSVSANSARAASSQSVSASTALPRSQPSSNRRSAQASSPARGVRRATRPQNARSGSSSSALSRQSPLRAADAGGERDGHPGAAVGARPGGRAERGLGVVPQPQRGLQPAQAATRVLERAAVALLGLEREHGDRGVRVLGQAGGSVARASSRGRARARRRAAPRRTRSRDPRRA